MAPPPPVQRLVIRQAERGVFRRLNLDWPVVIAVQEGEKRIEVDGRRLLAQAGEAVAISAPAIAHVTNIPGDHGRYRAEAFVFAPPFLTGTVAGAGGDRHGAVPLSAGLGQCLDRLAGDLEPAAGTPDSIVRHRAAEVLLWLREAGIRLAAEPPRGVAALVRRCVAAEPAKDWRADDIVAFLGRHGHAMSGATLRRRLQQEGASFSDILTQTRLSHALNLLQTTDFSVTRVAAEAGYDSAARFAVRFRLRFGLSPSALRGRGV